MSLQVAPAPAARGCGDGARSWLAAPPSLWLCRCWNNEGVLAQMVPHPRVVRSWGRPVFRLILTCRVISSFQKKKQGGQWPVLTSQKPQVQRRWQHGQGTRGTNPEEVLAAARKGAAVGERHRSFGRQRVSRSLMVGSSTPGSPPSSPRAAFGDSSRRCQAFIQRSRNGLTRMEQERAAEQKELDAAQVRLTRLREEMMRASSPAPTQLAATPVLDPPLVEAHQLRARVAEMEAEREEFR